MTTSRGLFGGLKFLVNICMKKWSYNFQINDFSPEANIIEQEKLSADWDSNPDPLVSGQVPLPLDHLHSSLLTAF